MHVVRVLPEETEIEFSTARPRDLLDLLTAGGVLIESECGGKGKCEKCLVELVSGSLNDRRGGPARPLSKNMYLACRSVPSGDCVIRVAGRAGDSSILDGLIAGSIGTLVHETGRAERLGLAVDIGTTTVVALLVDLEAKMPVAVDSETNPQRAHGSDVVSRIAFSCEITGGRSGTDVLQEAVVGSINRLIGSLCERAGQDAGRIESVVCAGNTAMQHFLLGVTPEHLGMSPYEAEFQVVEPRRAREIGLHLPVSARLEVLPNIRSFVGADTVGCLLSIEQEERAGFTIMLDMGTNTEMVIGRGQRRAACSAAAGPAFEGAHLTHGMRATPGAVSSVWLDDAKIAYRTISGDPALGICGSGIVDAVATLRRLGVVEACGRMPQYTEYAIVGAAESGNGQDVTVTRKDIREIQLVKASIATGMGVLLEEFGIGVDDLECIYVAGAFGNYMDVENARYIGLLPDLPADRFEPIGDAALKGAYIVLTGGAEAMGRATDIALGTDHVVLAARPDFQGRFLDNLDLEAYPEVSKNGR